MSAPELHLPDLPEVPVQLGSLRTPQPPGNARPVLSWDWRIRQMLSSYLPLLLMALAFKALFAGALLVRARCEILELEQHTSWVRELVAGGNAR